MDRYEGKNLGGVSALMLIALKSLSFPQGSILKINDISVAEGSSWTDIAFTPETASFLEMRKNSISGGLYEKQIKFSIPAKRKEISDEISFLSERPIAALVTDMNGKSFLVYPLRMEFAGEVPPGIFGYNGYHAVLTGESAMRSQTITFA